MRTECTTSSLFSELEVTEGGGSVCEKINMEEGHDGKSRPRPSQHHKFKGKKTLSVVSLKFLKSSLNMKQAVCSESIISTEEGHSGWGVFTSTQL